MLTMKNEIIEMRYSPLKENKYSHYPQQPHGGKLIDQVITGKELETETNRAKTLPSIRVDLEAIITLEMIATGVLSPNDGFMKEDDYNSVLKDGRLTNGLVWPVPLSFAPIGKRNNETIATLNLGDEISLNDEDNEPVAIMKVEDIFTYDKTERASHLFNTTDRNHPGVDSIFRRMGDTSLGGPIRLLNRVDWGPFEKLRLEPKDTFRIFYDEKKFRSAAGFITGANPLHRGHEYIHRNALEEVDGLLLQPLVEMAKREYTRNEYRMLAYRNVLDTYYPKDKPTLAPLRVTYIFAGPRETILHALIMKNYGCTHALIGRDHAGVGDYYDKYESHSIFDDFSPEELGIDVRLFYEVFHCTRCDSLASTETCPHDERYHINISGTSIREMLRHGYLPPKEIVRPESSRIAIQGIQPKGVDENDMAISPVGKIVKSTFPFYLNHTRLGGPKRRKPLDITQLTIEDLEAANHDARNNANRIYQDVFDEYSSIGDTNRNLQPGWIAEAREAIIKEQNMVIEDLKEKINQAPDHASDEFMYQDKEEAKRELEVATKILEEIPQTLKQENQHYKTWNTLPYDRYRGSDEE